MEVMKCFFCHQDVPVGAFVCAGCQAEISYNEPTFIGRIVLFLRKILMFFFGILFICVPIFERGFEKHSVVTYILGITSIWLITWLQKKYLTEKEPIFFRNRKVH